MKSVYIYRDNLTGKMYPYTTLRKLCDAKGIDDHYFKIGRKLRDGDSYCVEQFCVVKANLNGS